MTAISTGKSGASTRDPLHASSVTAAKAKFLEAAKSGVAELMRQHGYSRERATALLLRALKRGDSSPGDNEIFRLMGGYGIGMNDASSALIISRAIQRAKAERGISAAEAIEDLTSRMNVATLLEPRDDCESSSDASPDLQNHKTMEHVCDAVDVAPHQKASQRKPAKRSSKSFKGKKPSKNNAASNKSTVHVKQSGRKRSISDDKKKNEVEDATRRVRADSVSEVEIVKKAKMSSSPDEAPKGRAMSPPTVVRKRGLRVEEPQGSATKRARTEL